MDNKCILQIGPVGEGSTDIVFSSGDAPISPPNLIVPISTGTIATVVFTGGVTHIIYKKKKKSQRLKQNSENNNIELEDLQEESEINFLEEEIKRLTTIIKKLKEE